ncbi:MAG TPA: type II secretion system protein [Planctomycetota bacterium]|jgi:prepilin-type N-terminal cleavage/methylation domain-containing protein|nr:type II secretion system protein [Planctomycetota bacterium]
MDQKNQGFSLVELLVVMAILGTLAGLAVVGIPRILRASHSKSVAVVIQQLAVTLEAYSRRPANGDYPPTLLTEDALPGVGVLSNEENCGIESVLVCINRVGQSAGFEVEEIPWKDALTNWDDDRTAQTVTSSFGPTNRELYELCDRWGTPFAYFHHRDYDQVEVRGLGKISDPNGDGTIRCQPWKNPKTGHWYLPRGFQLISAGPDTQFNTEDDITNFER